MEVSYILNKEQFLGLKSAWKQLADADDIKAEDVVVYNILRGKDSKSGFAPTTNPKKIQGLDPWYEFKNAVSNIAIKYLNKRGEKVYHAGTYITASEFQEIRKDSFKQRYGVDLTDALVEALG